MFEGYYRNPEETLAGETWHKREAYHLVSENAVEPVMVQRDHPVEALQLITSHHAVYDCQKKTLSPRYSQLGDSSNMNGVSVPSPAISLFLSTSSSSPFSDLRWRALVTVRRVSQLVIGQKRDATTRTRPFSSLSPWASAARPS